jgi:hypothetical protein
MYVGYSRLCRPDDDPVKGRNIVANVYFFSIYSIRVVLDGDLYVIWNLALMLGFHSSYFKKVPGQVLFSHN